MYMTNFATYLDTLLYLSILQALRYVRNARKILWWLSIYRPVERYLSQILRTLPLLLLLVESILPNKSSY